MAAWAHVIGAVFGVSLLLTSFDAMPAEFTAKDGQILGRAMGYVGDGRTGPIVVGVVVVPGSTTSQHEAELVQAIIGDGLSAGRVRLQARLVPIDRLSTVNAIDALYVTSASAAEPQLLLAAQRLRIPAVSTDMGCVEREQCSIGFTSDPTVQIVISRAVTGWTGIHFMQAFRMLVTER